MYKEFASAALDKFAGMWYIEFTSWSMGAQLVSTLGPIPDEDEARLIAEQLAEEVQEG